MPALPWKDLLHYVGSGIGIIGIVFISQRLYLHFDQINISNLDLHIWLGLCVLGIIYGFSNQLLSISWWIILRFLGVNLNKNTAIRIYGISLLGKYVPSNIFQFAGRQALGLAAGCPGKALLKSTFWELGIISIAGTLYGIIAIPLLFSQSFENITILIFPLCMLGLFFIIKNYLDRELSKVFLLYLFFLGISGVVFSGIIGLISPELYRQSHFISIGSVYVIAWLIGLITPGAPAGLGVRELVLVGLLANSTNEADVVFAALLGRIVTIFGDVIYSGYSTVYYRQKKTS